MIRMSLAISTKKTDEILVADMVEPGSTFKLVTAIAAVEQGVIEDGELFETPEDGAVLFMDLLYVIMTRWNHEL